MNTIQDYLSSDTIDIALLLTLVLNKNTAELITHADYCLTSAEQQTLQKFIQQRADGTPFSYISGTKGFYHLTFKVTTDTLIPRPETELLIDIALTLFSKDTACQILDLGTGSGIIAITLADKNPHWQVVATDYSHAALEVAKANATSNIQFAQGSWFEPVNKQYFDLIISNPPYIKENDTHLKALTFEPISALTAGQDGLSGLRIIINNAPSHLNKNGYLLLEHGYDQQATIIKLLAQNFTNIQTFKDYNQQNRAVLAQLKN